MLLQVFKLDKGPFTHTTVRCALLCVAARFGSKHRCVFFRYEYSYVDKIWLTMMVMMCSC